MEVTVVRGARLDPSPELRCRRSSRLGDGDDDLGLEPTGKEVSEVRKCLHDLIKTKKGRPGALPLPEKATDGGGRGVRRNRPSRRSGARENTWSGSKHALVHGKQIRTERRAPGGLGSPESSPESVGQRRFEIVIGEPGGSPGEVAEGKMMRRG